MPTIIDFSPGLAKDSVQDQCSCDCHALPFHYPVDLHLPVHPQFRFMQIDGFILRETDGIRSFECAALAQYPELRHAFSTRSGGVSRSPEGALNLGHVPWDSPGNVVENRRRFLSAHGLAPDSLATVAQYHSAEFHIIKTPLRQWNPSTPGDALLSRESRVALAVLVADCIPVLLFDPATHVIAAVHAGWRGTLARILTTTVHGMRTELGVDPSRLLAAYGPGIRSCCFEVGSEVVEAFTAAFPGIPLSCPHPVRREKYFLDLPRALDSQLSDSGVMLHNRFDLGLCTCCHPEHFFSYRRESQSSGRLMALICRP
jgi:YfiH family protein